MKKILLAALLPAAFAGISHAQTSVTVYGIVDTGFIRESGNAAGSVNKLSSGIGSTSRLGFRGMEDLGRGTSALFVLESGFRNDTGEQDLGGSAFNRQAYVGLKSPIGTLTLGRQYTSYYTTLVNVADPFAAGYAGSSKNLFPTVGNNTRTSNTILYATPVVSGFNAELSYAFGEQADDNDAGRQLGAAIGYANGPLALRLAYLNRNNDISVGSATAAAPAISRDITTNTVLAGNYNLGVVKAYLAYGLDRGPTSAVIPNTGNPFGGIRATPSTDSRDMLVGVSIPFGATTVLASYIHKDDRTAFNQDANQLAIGGLYAVSKRTSFYTSYARIDNRNGAGYTVGTNAEVGTGSRAINAGVRHAF